MRRRLFNAIALLSLALLLASAALWLCAWRSPTLKKLSDSPAGGSSVSLDAGRVTYFHYVLDADPVTSQLLRGAVLPGVGGRPWRNAGFALEWRRPLSIAFGGGKPSTFGEWTVISVPFWSLIALSAPLPLAWLARRLRSRLRGAAGLCPGCGYDVRASADRCPECGKTTDEGGRMKADR